MANGANTIDEALCALRNGNAVVFPTDTVYGVGVAVGFAPAPDVLFRLKRRDPGKPVAWLVASSEDLETYGCDVPPYAFALAQAFWPGPLTIIVRAGENVSRAYCSAEGTVGLRMPDNPTALSLIRRIGCPIATSSANYAGEAPAYDFCDMDSAFVREAGCAVADSEKKSGVASTVLDCTGERPRILREGGVSEADIARCIAASGA